MNNPLQPFLDRFGIVILDGGLATQLERRGADLDDPLWSAKLLLENPDLIRGVHHDYLQAGADVITTASYQATFQELGQRGLNCTDAADVLRSSVLLAQQARDQFWFHADEHTGRLPPLVAASIGSYGAFLHDGSEYRGDYGLSVEQLVDFHRPRFDVLARSGADLLACETIPCLAEGRALVQLLREYSTTPAWLGFSCKDQEHVCHGERLADCILAAQAQPNVVACGINCTAPNLVSGLLRSINQVTSKPIIVYPNSGETWEAASRCWRGHGEASWTSLASQWRDLGARLIGGCCRTTPDDIAALRRCLERA